MAERSIAERGSAGQQNALQRRVKSLWIASAAGALLACGPRSPLWLAAAAPQPTPQVQSGSAAALPRSGTALLELLPPELRERAAPVLAESDPVERSERLREFSRAADARVVPFLLALIESEPSTQVRGRAAHELARWPEPAARAALARIAATDPSARVSLLALEDLYEVQVRELLGVLEQRMERGAAEPAEREALASAHDHWVTLARGGLLPAFLREAPPVFAALPARTAKAGALRVALFGDFGSGEEPQRRTAAALARAHARTRFDLGLTLGDNFYPSGMSSPQHPRWDALWTSLYEPLGIPFYPTLGNHDWSDPSSPAAEVLHRSPSWIMPATRYSFTAGSAQFFALDTAALSAQQLDWLRGELERSRATWKIVYGHHPIRSHGAHGDEDDLVSRLLPVLSGRADLYLAGHDHDMQYLVPEGGVHLAVIGSGGASVRPTEPGPRSLFCASRYGFGELELEPRRLALRFIDSELRTLHEVVLERDAQGALRPAVPAAPARSCLGPTTP